MSTPMLAGDAAWSAGTANAAPSSSAVTAVARTRFTAIDANNFRMTFLLGQRRRSAIERRVDQRDVVPPLDNAELARAEKLAELARADRDRTGLADAGLSGC